MNLAIDFRPFRPVKLLAPRLEQSINLGIRIVPVVSSLRRPVDVVAQVGVGPRSPAPERPLEIVALRPLLQHRELQRSHVADHPNLLQCPLQQCADPNPLGSVRAHDVEFERNPLPLHLPVANPIAVAVHPPRRVEQFLGLVEILLNQLRSRFRRHPRCRVVRPRRPVEQPEVDCLEQFLVIERQPHRPPHPHILEIRRRDVPREHEGRPLHSRGLRVQLVELVVVRLLHPLLGGHLQVVHIPLLQRQQRHRGLHNHPQPHRLEVRLVAHLLPVMHVPLFPPFKEQFIPPLPGHQPVRTTHHRIVLQLDMRGRLLHRRVFGQRLFVDVLGQQGHADAPDVGRQRFLMKEHHRPVVVRLHPGQPRHRRSHRRNIHPWVHDHLEGEFQVVRGDRLAIRPGQVVPQHQLVGHPVAAGLPRRNHIGVAHSPQVAVKRQRARGNQRLYVGLVNRARQHGIGAFHVGLDVPVQDRVVVNLVGRLRHPPQRPEDFLVGVPRGVLQSHRLGDRDRRRLTRLGFSSHRQQVFHRVVDPVGPRLEVGQFRSNERLSRLFHLSRRGRRLGRCRIGRCRIGRSPLHRGLGLPGLRRGVRTSIRCRRR